ncbi:unnamed protein product [Durusdinium trenchii]|uniref:Uncharacterized protein n=1 Tax=Durusdinium trenchii TaxID=1381693 RepID=A0ABP0KTX5_9DINO
MIEEENLIDEIDRNSDFRAHHFIVRCLQDNRVPFLCGTIIGTISLIITMTMCIRHSMALDRRPICMLRTYYHGMLIYPMVWAVCCWVSLFCPLTTNLSELFMGQSEAYAIYIFLVILYMLVSIEACKKRMETGGAGESLRTEMMNMGQTVMEAIHEYGPQKYFAVPPFGCCFWRCCTPHHITAKQLLWVSRLVKQYVLLELFLNTFFMWCGLTFLPVRAKKMQSVAGYILKASGMLAIYGLFVMYKATHDLLHDWNTTRKFVAIKLVILLSVIQNKLFGLFIRKFRPPDESCLLEPNNPKDLEHVIAWWTTFATLVETVLLSHLIIKAFPAHEVSDYPLKNLDLVEMELRQIHESESTKGGSLSMETSSSDGDYDSEKDG